MRCVNCGKEDLLSWVCVSLAMAKRRVYIAFTRLRVGDGDKFMVSVHIRGYSAFVCPLCGNVITTNGGYMHLLSHGIRISPSKLSSKLSYTVVMHADEDTVRGLAVLLNVYLTTSGYMLLMGKRVVGVGKHVFATLAALIREKPNVFADVFMQVIPLAALAIPLSNSVAIYVFKFGKYMTLYVGYDFATGTIAMIEKDGDVLYTRGTNADSLAKRVYDLITERREMWRRKWKQRSEKRQVVSNAAPPPPPNDTRITSTVAANTPTAVVPSRVGNSINNAGGDGSTSTAPGDLEKFVEELNANPWVDQIKKKAANTNTPAAAALDKPINNAGSISSLAMFERLVKEGGEEARKTFEKLVRGDFSGTRTSK